MLRVSTEGGNAGLASFGAPTEAAFGTAAERTSTARAAARPDDGAYPANDRGPALFGRRILVVEDDFLIAYELALFIESLGAEVAGPFAATASARLALEAGRVDGALLDVNLGRETSLALARDLAGLAIPVIFITAHAEESSLFDGPLAAMPRLGKPVARAILQRRAAELFG